MSAREVTWWGNKIMFDEEIEELLSHCPNMIEEDDRRDICDGHCPLYELYCISIEPSEEEKE